MPNLKELKNRIGSVKSTQKITKAKQMVAAAKLRRAQEAAEASRPYAQRLAAVISNLSSANTGSGGPKLLAGTGSTDTHLLLILTAERGLCGGFNANTAKLARQTIGELRAEGKTVKIITIGKKGRDSLSKEYGDMFIDHVDLSEVKQNNFAEPALALGRDITARFADGEFDIATLIYSEFKSVLTQNPVGQRMFAHHIPLFSRRSVKRLHSQTASKVRSNLCSTLSLRSLLKGR